MDGAQRLVWADGLTMYRDFPAFYEGEETMKLHLLLIIMDLLMLLAIPVVYLLGKLRQFQKRGAVDSGNLPR